MSKKIKWFKSSFSQDNHKENETPSKIPRKSNSFSNIVETISLLDDNDDDDTLLLSATSSISTNNAKEEEIQLTSLSSSSTSTLSSKISTNNKIQNLKSISQLSDKNWLDMFEPQTIDDLAIHPKKIADIQDWLKHYEKIKYKYPAQILLITGPTGCGKTITIKVLSKLMNYELIEWINPIDIESFECNSFTCNTKSYGYCSHKESQIVIFRRFLFQSSRYKSLLDDNDHRIILIEDFPNIFIRDPNEFHNILSDYCTYGKSPLVFIVTDSKNRNLNISHNLFPDHIKCQYNIANISFNPISTTLMKKILKKISTNLKQDSNKNDILKIPSDDNLNDIILTANGDIRNAILNLQLIVTKGTIEFRKESVKNSSNNKRNKNKNNKLTSIGRDETLTTMHALGRVLYPKYNPDNPSKLIHSPENIADIFTPEARNFLNLIHANYLAHFKCIEEIVNASDNISLSDIIMNDYRLDEMNFNNNNLGLCLTIRSVMINNKNSTNNWAPIKGVYKQNENNSSNIRNETYRRNKNITNNVFATDYNTYMKIINKS